jgi:hypothetical protein
MTISQNMTRRLALAAGLVSTALAAPAYAQYHQDNGRALDANPRAGSGGRNDDTGSSTASNPRGPLVTGNQIVTGNVTGGRHFRGFTPYSDPTEFRGITGSRFVSDRFIRDSAGVPRSVGGVSTQIDLSRPQAFYGSQRATPPAPGYVPVSGTGTYIVSNPSAINTDLRAQTLNLGLSSTARPGELVLPTIDQTNRQTLLSASPLYGVRVWDVGTNPNSFLLQNGSPAHYDPPGLPMQPLRPGESALDRFRADQSVLQMRDELNRTVDNPGAAEQPGQQGKGQGQGQGGQQSGLVQPLNTGALGAETASGRGNAAGTLGETSGQNQAQGQGQGVALRPGALSTQLGTDTVGGESGLTGQGIQHRLRLAPADKQTPKLAELRRQFERRHGAEASDVEVNRQFNLEMRVKAEADKAAQANPQDAARRGPGGVGARGSAGRGAAGAPDVPGAAGLPGSKGTDVPSSPKPGAVLPGTVLPGTEPGPGTAPGLPGPTPAPDGSPAAALDDAKAPVEPVKVGSIADDVQAKGLRDLLKSAEDLMRQEKYAAALDKYNTAQDVAPNNPLIGVGRAHAELAASYYRRAETDLRDAVTRAPHLAEAQFDLKSLIGPDRLQVIVKDLKDLADSDKTQARPLLLLGYIAYNTGNQAQAVTYLDAAQKRTQGDDALLKAWRGSWTLPKSDKKDADGSDQNK